MSNSYGNTNKQVRRFLREHGIPPTMGNVERIGKEVRRSQTENERVERIAKETGRAGTFDARGRNMHGVVKRIVRKQLDGRS